MKKGRTNGTGEIASPKVVNALLRVKNLPQHFQRCWILLRKVPRVDWRRLSCFRPINSAMPGLNYAIALGFGMEGGEKQRSREDFEPQRTHSNAKQRRGIWDPAGVRRILCGRSGGESFGLTTV
jgi:hypothetical protein